MGPSWSGPWPVLCKTGITRRLTSTSNCRTCVLRTVREPCRSPRPKEKCPCVKRLARTLRATLRTVPLDDRRPQYVAIASETRATSLSWKRSSRKSPAACPLAFQVDPILDDARKAFADQLAGQENRLQRRLRNEPPPLAHGDRQAVERRYVRRIASKPVVLLGVGWRGHASRRPPSTRNGSCGRCSLATAFIPFRDSYAEGRLREIGVENVINTACPTMLELDAGPLRSIPAEQGEDVVMTLTDYSPEPQKDRQLLDLLKRIYRRVYLWRQGAATATTSPASPGCMTLKSCRRPCRLSTSCWPTGRSRWTTWALGCMAASALDRRGTAPGSSAWTIGRETRQSIFNCR